MKYVKAYKRFINESKREMDKHSIIIEKELLTDFSSNFWGMCINSSVFTNEEKSYIKENLSDKKVDLLTEEWDWLNKTVNWAKEKSKDTLKWIGDKIKSIRNGISAFVKSMIEYARKIFLELIRSALKASKSFADKHKDAIKKKIESADKDKAKTEIARLVETFKFWGITTKIAADSVVEFKSDLSSKIYNMFKSSEQDAIADCSKNLEEAEKEVGGETVQESNDVLSSFYDLSKLNESESSGEKKGAIDWILGFLGQEKMDPDAKAGSKLLWWGKLFFKVLATCLNPILKVVETVAKQIGNTGLELFSWITNLFGGPPKEKKDGVKEKAGKIHYEFILLGGITAGLFGLVVDSMLLGHIHFSGDKMLSKIKVWLSKSLSHAFEFFPQYKVIKDILTAFCLAMTVWHVVDELKHLSHSGGHGEHGDAGLEH